MSETMVQASARGLNGGDVFAKLQGIMAEILVLESPETLKADARLIDDLQIDSLGMVDIVIGVEQAFGIRIGSDTNLFERLVTVSDVVDLILELAANKR